MLDPQPLQSVLSYLIIHRIQDTIVIWSFLFTSESLLDLYLIRCKRKTTTKTVRTMRRKPILCNGETVEVPRTGKC